MRKPRMIFPNDMATASRKSAVGSSAKRERTTSAGPAKMMSFRIADAASCQTAIQNSMIQSIRDLRYIVEGVLRERSADCLGILLEQYLEIAA